jgi:RecA-family ATPase
VVTLLGAHGGTGKSLVALMLSVAAATGRPLFGVPTERTYVLFASFEDATPVLRRRLANICRASRITSGGSVRIFVFEAVS